MSNIWEKRVLWIGLIFSGLSLLVSAFALLFTYRQLTSPYQQQLYTKQLDVVIDIQKKSEDLIRVALSYISEDPSLGGLRVLTVEEAAEAMDESLKAAGHVLPSALFSYATAVNGSARELAKAARDCKDTGPYAARTYNAILMWYIQSRRFLGVDELSPLTARLYGQDQVLNIDDLKIDRNTEFGKFYSERMGL